MPASFVWRRRVGSVTAGQGNSDVCERRPPSGISWWRCHLVGHLAPWCPAKAETGQFHDLGFRRGALGVSAGFSRLVVRGGLRVGSARQRAEAACTSAAASRAGRIITVMSAAWLELAGLASCVAGQASSWARRPICRGGPVCPAFPAFPAASAVATGRRCGCCLRTSSAAGATTRLPGCVPASEEGREHAHRHAAPDP